MASISFQSPQSIAIQGRIKTAGGPKTCKRCARNAIRRNPQQVPLHPNCRCKEARKTTL